MAGALIVIDVLTLASGMPSKRTFMSSTEQMETPTLPTQLGLDADDELAYGEALVDHAAIRRILKR